MAAVLIASAQPGPTALDVIEANGTCYDAALIGRIVEADDFEDFNEVLRRQDDILWWGGVTSFHVRKDAQLIGSSPRLGWVRAMMTDQPLPTTKVLLLTKAHASGVPIVVYWTIMRKAAARELSKVHVQRCP
jgi:hypothetical protein